MKKRYATVLANNNFIFAKYLLDYSAYKDGSVPFNGLMLVNNKSCLLFSIYFYIDLFGLSKDWVPFLQWHYFKYESLEVPYIARCLSFKQIKESTIVELVNLGFNKYERDFILL